MLITTNQLATEFATSPAQVLAVLTREGVKPGREVRTAQQTRRQWPPELARSTLTTWRLSKAAAPAITPPVAEKPPVVVQPLTIVQEDSAGISNANLFKLFQNISRRLAEVAESSVDTNRKLTALMEEWGATEALAAGTDD